MQAKKRPRRKWRGWLTATIAVGLVLSTVWFVRTVRHAIHESFMAEARLHAMYFVLVQVREYVDDHKEWPRSWSNLPPKLGEPCAGRDAWFPTEFGPLQEFVEIDFGAMLDQVAKQTPETFTAVRFTPGAYYNHWYPIEEVIEAARRAVAANGVNPK